MRFDVGWRATWYQNDKWGEELQIRAENQHEAKKIVRALIKERFPEATYIDTWIVQVW